MDANLAIPAALIGFAQMAMAALGSVGVAALYNDTALPMAAVICTMGVGAALSYLFLVRPAAAK